MTDLHKDLKEGLQEAIDYSEGKDTGAVVVDGDSVTEDERTEVLNDVDSYIIKTKALMADNKRLTEALKAKEKPDINLDSDTRFIFKQVERGLFDKHTTPKQALKNIAYLPNAPWSQDSKWTWDVSHKEYAEEFYKKFPKGNKG